MLKQKKKKQITLLYSINCAFYTYLVYIVTELE